MGDMRCSVYPSLATALLLATAGCAPPPTPPAARLSDLCSTLPVADVQATYRRLTPTMWVTKRLDDSKFHTAGMASCHYGPKDDLGGVALSVPIGGPVAEVADLIGGSRARVQEVAVDSERAFFLRSESEAVSAIAVDHGSTQFVVTWTPLLGAPNEMATQQQVIALAKTVANQLPTDFVLPQQDIAAECAGVQAAEQIVGGQVLMARGSADGDTLHCDYLGRTGILRASATREADRFVDDQLRILRGSPQHLIDPPVDDNVALMVLSGSSMYLEGYLTGCCSLRFEHRAINDTLDYSGEFTAAQRQLVTTFVAAARNWSRRH